MELIFGGLFLARGYFLDVTWLMEIHDNASHPLVVIYHKFCIKQLQSTVA